MNSMESIESYNGEKEYIFISYSHKNSKKVAPILKKLNAMNYRIWFDEGLAPGDEFAKVLYNKVSNCCAVLLFLSDDVFKSNYCKFEIFTAHVLGKKICPFLLQEDKIDIPDEFLPIINVAHQIAISDTEGDNVNGYINRLPREAKDAMKLNEDETVIELGEQFSKRAVIPDSVIKIGPLAYKSRSELREIHIGSNTEVIGEEAFRDCNKVEDLVIPPHVKLIGDSSFRDCVSLRKLVIENHPEQRVIEIGERAFENCVSLESIQLPNDLKEIFGGCFNSCKALKKLTIPPEVTSIGENAFAECVSLLDVEIPPSVTKIDDLAFAGCSRLKNIKLNEGLLKLGKNTFKDCCSLEEVKIPASITKMSTSPFRGCSSLKRIIVEKSKYFKHEDGVLFNKSKSLLICYPANKVDPESGSTYKVPDSVTEIGEWAFSDCEGLKKVIIPDSVTDIGEGAFFKCRNLEHIDIPDSVVRMDDIIFRGCDNLKSITIPESVVEIGWGLFSGCPEDLVVRCKKNSKIYDYCIAKQIQVDTN